MGTGSGSTLQIILPRLFSIFSKSASIVSIFYQDIHNLILMLQKIWKRSVENFYFVDVREKSSGCQNWDSLFFNTLNSTYNYKNYSTNFILTVLCDYWDLEAEIWTEIRSQMIFLVFELWCGVVIFRSPLSFERSRCHPRSKYHVLSFVIDIVLHDIWELEA